MKVDGGQIDFDVSFVSDINQNINGIRFKQT